MKNIYKSKEISLNIQETFVVKEKLKLLLEFANIALEQAIKQDEIIAFNWLQN